MLMEAFAILQISEEDQLQVFSVLAAVLWLGNISFQVTDDENRVEVLADEAITTASRLMGCSAQELMLALSTHDNAVEDSIDKRLTLQQTIKSRLGTSFLLLCPHILRVLPLLPLMFLRRTLI